MPKDGHGFMSIRAEGHRRYIARFPSISIGILNSAGLRNGSLVVQRTQISFAKAGKLGSTPTALRWCPRTGKLVHHDSNRCGLGRPSAKRD